MDRQTLSPPRKLPFPPFPLKKTCYLVEGLPIFGHHQPPHEHHAREQHRGTARQQRPEHGPRQSARRIKPQRNRQHDWAGDDLVDCADGVLGRAHVARFSAEAGTS